MPHPFPNPPPHLRGAVLTLDHASERLRGNPWKDPFHRDLRIYLPPGYDVDEGRAWPAILVLAPYAGTGESLLARTLTEVSMAARIDRLIHAEDCPPFIAVLPDVMSSLGGSQFVDSPGIGDYASWLVEEILPFVDANFRTTGRWGVVGRSSGGFGALHLSATFPGTFQAVACHSGDMGFESCYLSDLHAAVAAVNEVGGPRAFVEAFWSRRQVRQADFAALALLCVSAAYTPDIGPSADDFPARLPVDFETGALDFDVLRSWLRFDPITRADDPAVREAWAALDLLYLDAGDHDEYLLHLGARRLSRKLEDAGIAHVHEEFPGGHRGTSFRYDRSLPLLARTLEAGGR